MQNKPYWFDTLSKEDQAFATLIIHAVEMSLSPGEDINSILTGSWHLATRRAALHERPVRVVEDLPFALSIFCWYPFKAELRQDVRELLRGARSTVFRGLDNETIAEQNLADIVPDEVLRLSSGGLMHSLEGGQIVTRLRIPEIREQ